MHNGNLITLSIYRDTEYFLRRMASLYLCSDVTNCKFVIFSFYQGTQ